MQMLSSRSQMSRLQSRCAWSTLSRTSSIFASTEAQRVARPISRNVENVLTRSFYSIGSRKASNSGCSTLGCLPRSPTWFQGVSLPLPTTPRQISTSSNHVESLARVSYSTRKTSREGTTGTIATITMSNPAKMNIVNSSILDDLVEACQKLSADESLRAAVLTGGKTAHGKSPSFIGGADIKEMNALSSSQDAKAFINKIHAACKALRDLPVPVIARVHGFSLGAGLEIMAACDLRIATNGSTFGMPEVKVGIPSVVEAALLPGMIGIGKTRRLLYLAENISAQEALQWGLVEKVVDDETALDSAVQNWTEIIAGMGPKAIRAQKKLVQTWENSTVEEGIQAGVEAFGEAYRDGGKEPKEYMGKFINRR